MESGSARTIVFIRGAWVTPACLDDFAGFFEPRGYIAGWIEGTVRR